MLCDGSVGGAVITHHRLGPFICSSGEFVVGVFLGGGSVFVVRGRGPMVLSSSASSASRRVGDERPRKRHINGTHALVMTNE